MQVWFPRGREMGERAGVQRTRATFSPGRRRGRTQLRRPLSLRGRRYGRPSRTAARGRAGAARGEHAQWGGRAGAPRFPRGRGRRAVRGGRAAAAPRGGGGAGPPRRAGPFQPPGRDAPGVPRLLACRPLARGAAALTAPALRSCSSAALSHTSPFHLCRRQRHGGPQQHRARHGE